MSELHASPPPARILVLDDEPDLRTLYELTLLREGYEVQTAANLAEGRAALADASFDAVITDMRLPDGEGLELLRELASGHRGERTIVITAYGSAENAVDALKCGAFDYLTKPVDLKQFRASVASLLKSRGPAPSRDAYASPARSPDAALKPGPKATRPDVGAGGHALQRIVGQSPTMRQVKQRIERVARSMAPVMLQGESGTGKELAARALHECSHRAEGPFVAVNCGAIPENLIEAEFFGVRKGAYTGAAADREGFFQAAHGGTLFLDEIGDLPLALQAKLLRVIQERRVRPLGSVQEDAVDVRLVSATHRDLGQAVREGRFRQDLFYRLNVIGLNLPPLRERSEDLPDLVQTLLQRLCLESGSAPVAIADSALVWLARQPLPGNVRELENLLHRALALRSGDRIEAEDLSEVPLEAQDLPLAASPMAVAPTVEPGASPEPLAPPSDLQRYLDEQERAVLMQVLKETGYNRTLAAARLGLNLRQIRYRIQRLEIPIPGRDDNHGGDAFEHD